MSPGGRRRIDEIGEESRRRILDAAEELFAERGFDRTSFVDISERSGISRGSIPWHFTNKNGLVMAVVERTIERAMPQGRYRSVPPLVEVFDDTAALMGEGDTSLLFVILAGAIKDRGDLQARCREFLARHRNGLERWARVQRPAGLDPEIATARERAFAAALHGALLGVQLQALVDPDGFDLHASLRLIAGLVDEHLADLWSPR